MVPRFTSSALAPSSLCRRSAISPAALLVKVNTQVRRGRRRQGERKRAARAWRRFAPYPPTVGIDDSFGDRQAEADAPFVVLARLPELFENVFHQLWRNTRPAVADTENDFLAFERC